MCVWLIVFLEQNMSAIIESLWEHTSYLPLKTNLKGKSFRLKQWPNFGFSSYQPEYVTLAACLTHRTLDAKQLRQLTGYQKHQVNSFLNAAYLMDLLEVQEETHPISERINQKLNDFAQRMRQYFGFET